MLAVMNGTVSRSVTAKALAVLGTFDPGHTRRTLSEIATAAELPPSTTHRLVAELVVVSRDIGDTPGRLVAGMREGPLGEV